MDHSVYTKPEELKGANRCFGCGPANPIGLHLQFHLNEDGAVICPITVPIDFEGPTGFVHGGIIATMLDESMSKTVRAQGVTAMTRKMEIDYLRPVPSEKPVHLVGRLIRKDGRKHWTEAQILNAEGTILAQSTGLFIEVRAR